MDWRASTWGDEISLEYGKALRGYAENNGRYRVFGSNGAVGWTDTPLAQGPGVILGRKGAYRGVRYSPDPFFVIDTAYYVVPKTDLDMRWLFYAIKHHKLGEIDDGSPIPSTTRSAVYVRDMDVPARAEQQAIAAILSALDDKIELNRRMNGTLEASARALFRDWLVDFGPTRAKADGSTAYLASDLWSLFPDRLGDDGVPEGWAAGILSDLVEVSPNEPLKRGTVAPYLDMAAIPTAGPNPDQPVSREYGSGTRFRNGDTLLARITPCLENGKTAFVQNLPEGAVGWGSTEFIVLRSRSQVPPAASYLLARDGDFRRHAIRSMTGTSGRQRADASAIAAYPVSLPSDGKLWSRLREMIDPLFDRIAFNAAEAETLAATRDTLLPKLMSGEIRVSDVDTKVIASL